MNAVTEIGKQLRELFSSLTPSARIMTGLMMGVIVVSLGWIVSTEVSGDYESLLGGVVLTYAELDRIETAFGDAQLRDYYREGRQIRIPKGQKDQYLKALSAADALPKEWGSEIKRAMDAGNVFESSEKFSARMQTAEEHELANILKRMPGIEFAAVRLDEQRKGFGRQTERVCSIQLQGPQNTPIPDATLRRIRDHVSKHFANLPTSSISVLDLGTSNVFHESNDPRAASENPVLVARQQWEGYLGQKIGGILADYGAVRLMVDVEIDPVLVQEQEKLAYDPTAVTLQSIESRKDSENTKGSPAGPPGADANGIGNKAQRIDSATAGQASKIKESEANERRVAGHDATRLEKAGLTPTKVSVSIGIPDSHFRKVFGHRYLLNTPDAKADSIPAPTPQELTDLKTEIESTIRSAVESVAMGIRDGDDRKPFVNVYAYTDLNPTEFPEPSLASSAMLWLGESWSTVALLLIVVVSLGMMFSWIKSQGESDTDRQFAEGFGLQVPENMGDRLDISDEDDDSLDGKQRSKPEFEVSGGEMKEDLSTLIKENPDAVVNLLKTWIGDAA
jgi:flagellar M-ring protein FliF